MFITTIQRNHKNPLHFGMRSHCGHGHHFQLCTSTDSSLQPKRSQLPMQRDCLTTGSDEMGSTNFENHSCTSSLEEPFSRHDRFGYIGLGTFATLNRQLKFVSEIDTGISLPETLRFLSKPYIAVLCRRSSCKVPLGTPQPSLCRTRSTRHPSFAHSLLQSCTLQNNCQCLATRLATWLQVPFVIPSTSTRSPSADPFQPLLALTNDPTASMTSGYVSSVPPFTVQGAVTVSRCQFPRLLFLRVFHLEWFYHSDIHRHALAKAVERLFVVALSEPHSALLWNLRH